MPEKLTKRLVESLQPQEKPYDIRDSELTGFLVRVLPGGTKSYFLDYRLNGRRNRYKIGSHGNVSADGARTIAAGISGDVARQIDPQKRKKEERAEAARSKVSTLRAFLDDQYEPWAKTHLKSYRLQLARIRSDYADLLDKQLRDFQPSLIEGLRIKWKDAGLQPVSINRDIQRLHSVLSKATAWGIVPEHPFSVVKPLKTDKTGRVRFLSAAEEARLRKALVGRDKRLIEARQRFNAWRQKRGYALLPDRKGEVLDHLKPMVLLALNTGLRRGELLSLKWSDVNLPAEVLTVVAASSKSGQSRSIPLNAEALAVLKSWRKRNKKEFGFVFAGADGSRMDNINRSWDGLRTAAKLDDFNFHDLRHTFASRLVQAGIALNTVRELMGHADIQMTQRYAHLAPGTLRAAVQRVAG